MQHNDRCSMKIYIVSMCAIILWGLSYIWCDKLIDMGIPVEYFIFVRTLVGGCILFAANMVAGRSVRIKRKDFPVFLLLALCEPFIYFTCETYGLKLTESPTYSALIVSSTPIVSVAAGMLFFKEKMHILNILGILACLGGLVMVTLCAEQTGEHFIFGVILLMVAVFAEVGHASCTKPLSAHYEPIVIVMYQFLIGSVFLLPLFVGRGLRNFDAELYLSWKVFRPILCLALFCSSIAFSLWVSSIKHLGVARSSIFLALVPITTALVGMFTGREMLSALQWVGVAVAIFGVIVSQICFKRKTADKNR